MSDARPPIYVDTLMVCMRSNRWPFNKSCHMFIDAGGDLEILHRFAETIGLRRAWFQNRKGSMPHYDLNESRRRIAVANGAVELDRRATVAIIRAWRGQTTPEDAPPLLF